VELTTDYVLGKGMALKADGEAVQGFVDAFWEANRMQVRQFELCTELSLSGELFVTFHTSPFDGMTLIRCMPAAAVDRVETNPEDVEDERRYHRAGAVANTVEGIEWSVVSGVVNGEIHISIRNVGYVRGAGEVARAAFGDLGSAGGHRSAAKAVIPVPQWKEAEKHLEPAAVRKAIVSRFLQALKEET